MTDLIFTDAHVRAAIAAAIPVLKPGNTNAVVAGLDQRGVQVAVSVEFDALKSEWGVRAVARHEWSGSNFVEGDVILQW